MDITLQQFLRRVFLWLPICFFFWWWASGVWTWFPIRAAGFTLTHLWPSLFASAVQQGAEMEVTTRILITAGGGTGAGELVLTPNPMAYGYALPLFVAFVLSSQVHEDRHWADLGFGALILGIGQAIGLVGETLKLLAFDSGDAGATTIAHAGINLELIALLYQFGYLILPAVLAPALWLALNRPFLDAVMGAPPRAPARDNNSATCTTDNPADARRIRA